MKLYPRRALLIALALTSSSLLAACGAKPLKVRAELPICPEAPPLPKSITDPVEMPSWLQ